MSKLLATVVLLCSVYSFAAQPQKELTFGPEFTFSNSRFTDEGFIGLMDLEQALMGPRHPNRYRYGIDIDDLPDELSSFVVATGVEDTIGIRFTRDPGVVEVTTTPMTVEQIEKYKDILQRDIFDLIKRKKRRQPAQFLGGGHISIRASYFVGREPLLFYNFVIDFFNNNQLALGIWNYDTNNALPFALLNTNDKKRVLTILKTWLEKTKARTERLTSKDIQNIGRKLHNALYNTRDMYCAAWNRCSSPLLRGKHHALNFLNIGSDATSRIEIRSFRPQKDIQTYLNQVKLIAARVKYLEKMKRPLSYKTRVPILRGLNPVGEHKLTPPVDPQLALQAFYQFVTESGEKWVNHRDYVWPMWISGGELEKFEQSQWFLENEEKNTCAGALR